LKFSTKTRYGIRALLEIALNRNGAGVFQKDIAENQKISNKYLDQIISSLKVANLISNVKGKKSGYILTRKPEEITMLDIHNAFEPFVCIVDCLSENIRCDMESTCATREFWVGLNDVIKNYLTKVTLADIVKKQELITGSET